MFCDPSGVRSTHSLLGLGHDPRGVTEHRNDRRTKVCDPPYGGLQRRRDSPGCASVLHEVGRVIHATTDIVHQ